MRLLALTGSLRARSRNTDVLLALAELAPAGVEVDLFRALDALPHFNPDVEIAGPPPAALALRARLAAADAVVVCAPEYAHGVPGAFKNALDWLVGVGFERRPVGALNASPLSMHAFPALLEILATMDGEVLPAATVVLPRFDGSLSPEELARDPAVAAALRPALEALREAGAAWCARAGARRDAAGQ